MLFSNKKYQEHHFCNICMVFFLFAGEQKFRVTQRTHDEILKLLILPVGDFKWRVNQLD